MTMNEPLHKRMIHEIAEDQARERHSELSRHGWYDWGSEVRANGTCVFPSPRGWRCATPGHHASEPCVFVPRWWNLTARHRHAVERVKR